MHIKQGMTEDKDNDIKVGRKRALDVDLFWLIYGQLPKDFLWIGSKTPEV